MSDKLPQSFLPAKMQILSGSMLKVIAMVIMLIDHTAAIVIKEYPPALQPLFYINDYGYSFYRIMRDIGRAAFPIFCFLLVEGFLHTHNRFKYGRNLFLFALISEIPWNYMHADTWHYALRQNVFFTLFLGYLAFCAAEYFWENRFLQFLCLFGLLLVSIFLKADYGWRGYIFLLIMYFLRNEKASQAIVGSCWLYYEWRACFAFLPINMYNGKRGFIKGKGKYFFYIFYPLHITILVIIRRMLFGQL